MRKVLIALFALGIGAVSLSAMSGSAEAGGRHGWNGWHSWNGGYSWNHGYRGRFSQRRRVGIRHFSGGGCRFYLRKARRSGSSHWWRKYNWCVQRHGY